MPTRGRFSYPMPATHHRYARRLWCAGGFLRLYPAPSVLPTRVGRSLIVDLRASARPSLRTDRVPSFGGAEVYATPIAYLASLLDVSIARGAHKIKVFPPRVSGDTRELDPDYNDPNTRARLPPRTRRCPPTLFVGSTSPDSPAGRPATGQARVRRLITRSGEPVLPRATRRVIPVPGRRYRDHTASSTAEYLVGR